MNKQFNLSMITLMAFIMMASFFSCKKEAKVVERDRQVVRLPSDKLTLEVGEDSTLTATFLPEVSAPASRFKWEVLDPAVVEMAVNNDFSVIITAKQAGKTQAIVSSLDGRKYAICDITVVPVPNPTVTLNLHEASVFVDGELMLIPTFTPPVDRLTERYKWELENTQVASLTVNSDFSATITGKEPGETKVYIKTKNGEKTLTTATVTVTEEPIVGELKHPVLINFGSGSGVPDEWNNLSGFMAGASISNLKDKELEQTGISVTITERFNGANETGEATTTTDFDMPSAVSKTAFFGNSRADWGGLFQQAVLKFEGLNKDMEYDFCFYGSRTGVNDNREAKYIVMGKNEVTTSLNASKNTSEIACSEHVQPDANGMITVTVTMGDNNNNGIGFFYLNAMRVSASAD